MSKQSASSKKSDKYPRREPGGSFKYPEHELGGSGGSWTWVGFGHATAVMRYLPAARPSRDGGISGVRAEASRCSLKYSRRGVQDQVWMVSAG